MTKADQDGLAYVIAEGIKRGIAAAIAPRDEQIAALQARIRELEARPALHDRGLWTRGVPYAEGDVVTADGSAWVCTKTHFSVGRDLDHTAFRLLVKRGRDGRDKR